MLCGPVTDLGGTGTFASLCPDVAQRLRVVFWGPGQVPSNAAPSVPPPSGLSVLIRVRLELRRHQRAHHTIPGIFQAVARQQPDRLALVDAGSGVCWTFAQLDAYSNAVANVFHQLGLGPGDVVAIFLEGRPEFVGLWLGLAKAGVEAALLNVNLRREPLAFCLGTSGAKALIFGGELAAGEAGAGISVGREGKEIVHSALGRRWPILDRDTSVLGCSGG